MSKAFDKVSHAKLLDRLQEFGFGGSILKWFSSYMANRRQQTIVLGVTSTSIPVTSGVPQGSILGPLLFLLYENHLSNAVSNSRIATFADDTKIFKTAVQYDLSNVEKSSTNSKKAPLNVSRYKVLSITRKHNQIVYPYKLHYTRKLGL